MLRARVLTERGSDVVADRGPQVGGCSPVKEKRFVLLFCLRPSYVVLWYGEDGESSAQYVPCVRTARQSIGRWVPLWSSLSYDGTSYVMSYDRSPYVVSYVGPSEHYSRN
jgi:hypothetical protein